MELVFTVEPMTHVLQKQPHMQGLGYVSTDTCTTSQRIIYRALTLTETESVFWKGR